MAQFDKDNQLYIDGRRRVHSVDMLANKNGDIVDTDNRFPVDIAGQTITATVEPFNLQVAKGNIAGHAAVHRSGFNLDIDTNSDPESVWSAGGLYPWLQLNIPVNLYCVSTASDQEDLVINGLDSNYNDITETVNLNGTTGVTTTNTFRRINSVEYEGIGNNVGIITLQRNDGSGAILEQIEPAFCTALSMHYSVPAGKTAYLNKLMMSLQESKKGAKIILYIRELGSNFKANHIYEITEGTSTFEWPYPEKLPEKSDVDIVVYEAYENNTRISGCIDFLLVDNS